METFILQTLDFLKTQSFQVAIVFIGVLILTWLLQNKSAHVRYLLWLLVAVKCMTPPLVIFSVPVLPAESVPVVIPTQNPNAQQSRPSEAADVIETRSVSPINLTASGGSVATHPEIENQKLSINNFPIVRLHLTSANVLLSAWAAGAVCYLLWALGKAVRLAVCLRRIRRPLPAQLMIEQIEKLAKLWNYPGGFNVWLVDGITQPFVWGLWRGAIYLPTRFQSIEGDKQKAIVLHEMAHVVRFDAFVNLIQILIQGVFWFHPLVWLANKAIRQEREKCCDEIAVARLGTAPKEYGRAIVDTLLQEAKAGLAIPTLAVAGPVKNIEDRIKTIMQPGRRFFQRPSIVALLIIGCLAALVVPTTIALTQKVTPPDFVLSGIVTDANDRPIAGAIVFDDGYGPQPYQKGITDETGKFEYKSWNEEHNIAAKADGYQTQTINFTTFPLDNSKKLNFKLHPKTESDKVQTWVKDFFKNNYRDITACKDIEWGKPEIDDNGNISIRYKYEATIWGKDKIINNQMFTFDNDGKFLHVRKVGAEDIYSLPGVQALVEVFFANNYQDITQRKTIEWGEPTRDENSNVSVRYKYEATIWDKDKIINNQIFIFDKDGKFLLVKDAEPGNEEAKTQTETVHGQRPKGNCSIRGKVVSAQTGDPVRNAKVYLFHLGTHAAIFIDVASDGSFMFKSIPTGPFSLRTTHVKGFQDAVYNPERSGGDFPQFTLTDGEQRTDVILKVESSYSISGSIFSENGKPLKDSQMTILAWVELDAPEGNLNRYKIASQSQIASDGTYLLDGLDDRPVYVMAIDFDAQNKDDYWPPCYYPGTVARNDAQKVSFDDAKSVDGINIHLAKKGEFILEGSVTDEITGNAISKTLVTIHHRDMLFDRLTTYTDEKGHYRVESLGAGDFLVHVDAEPWGYVRTRKPVKIETAKVIQLDFNLRPAARISGKIADENGNPVEISDRTYGLAYREGYSTPETMSWSGVNNKYGIRSKSENEHGSGNTFNGGEGDYEEEYMDFPTSNTFVIEGMRPGKTILRFHPKSQERVLKEILYNGQNILETGIETQPGQEIKDVTIVVGKNNDKLMKSDSLDSQAVEHPSIVTNGKLPFTASLPNGVTVELVGICEHPSEGKPWWKPDGSELKDKPWDKMPNSVSGGLGRKAYEIALKLNWPIYAPGFYAHLDNVGSHCTGSRNLTPTSDLRYEIVDLPNNLETTDIHFAVASGPWQTRKTQKSPWQGVYVSGAVWQTPIGQLDKTILSVAHSFTQDQNRLVAIDKNGKEIVGHGNSGSTDGKTLNMQMTFDIKLEDIKEFQLQTRPYEHYAFKNVSLRPGQKTDVKIETDRPQNATGQTQTGAMAIFDNPKFKKRFFMTLVADKNNEISGDGKKLNFEFLDVLMTQVPDPASTVLEVAFEPGAFPDINTQYMQNPVFQKAGELVNKYHLECLSYVGEDHPESRRSPLSIRMEDALVMDQSIPVGMPAIGLNSDKSYLTVNSIQFSNRDFHFIADLKMSVISFPQRLWEIKIRLLDKNDKQLESVMNYYQNSGSNAFLSEQTLRFDFGKDDLSQVAKFEIEIRLVTPNAERLDVYLVRQTAVACVHYAGKNYGKLPEKLEHIKSYLETEILLPFDNMEYLQAGRRMSEIKDLAATVLLRMPLDGGKNGVIIAYCDCRTEYFSPERMKTPDYLNISLKPGQKTDVKIETMPTSGHKTEISEQNLAWGRASESGLRAAVELVPEKECYSFGEKIDILFKVHNAGEKTIILPSTTWRFGEESKCIITDKNGNTIPVHQVLFSGLSMIKRHQIAPGEIVTIKGASLMLFADDSTPDANQRIGYGAKVEPDDYSVHFELQFPDVIRYDTHRQPSSPLSNELQQTVKDIADSVPLPDDWQGTLITGKRNLCVTNSAPDHS